MAYFTSRYDLWHVILTLAPLVTGGLGALIVRQRPSSLGTMVVLYAALCIVNGLSPLWLADVAPASDGAMRGVLVETKLAFIFGLALILAAGGRKRPGAEPTGHGA